MREKDIEKVLLVTAGKNTKRKRENKEEKGTRKRENKEEKDKGKRGTKEEKGIMRKRETENQNIMRKGDKKEGKDIVRKTRTAEAKEIMRKRDKEEEKDIMRKKGTAEDNISSPATEDKMEPRIPLRVSETGCAGDTRVGVKSGEKSLAVFTLPSLWLTCLAMLTLACAVGLAEATSESVVSEESLPHFLEPIPNKTVVLGRDVILPCSVDNLKGFKVAWIFVETQTILTIHHTIITKNPRFSLARNDHKHWYLKITDVRPSDRGLYMCQVNSDPMMSQVGFLDVQVPPDIIDEESSSEVVVKEGQDVTLECRARGSPKPVISWKREDGGKIDGINLKVTDSEVLHIPSVSRLHMGAYLCIASNDVPPSVSKRILLQVQFQPVLWIPNQLVGVPQGMDVTLECHTESFPKSINYWTDERGQMILSSGRFDTIVAENGYKSYMRLKIKNIQPEDYMAYSCYAKNSFGETNGRVKIYEMSRQFVGGRDSEEGKTGEEEEEEEEEGHEEEEEVEVRGSNRAPEPRRENQTKRRKGKHEEEESGQKRTGFHSGFDPPSLRKLPSSAPSSPLTHPPILASALCLWRLTLLLVRV